MLTVIGEILTIVVSNVFSQSEVTLPHGSSASTENTVRVCFTVVCISVCVGVEGGGGGNKLGKISSCTCSS